MIKDDQAETLASMLSLNQTIASMDLSENDIGARGEMALGAVLTENPFLTSLDLRSNRMEGTWVERTERHIRNFG